MKNFFTRAALVLLAACIPAAHADIKDDLEDAHGDLKSQLDSRRAADATSTAEKLVKLYDKLQSASSGNDKSDAVKGKEDANRMVEAVKAFRQLQDHEDESDELATQCGRGKVMITKAVESFEKKQDAQAIKFLPEAAESARKLVQEPFEKARKRRSEMDRWHSTVLAFSPKLGKVWDGARSELRDAAAASFKKFTATFDKTEEECQRVVKGKDHPEVIAALKLIKTAHGQRAKDLVGLEQELDDWATMVNGFREWYRKDTDSIATAFCEADEDWKKGTIVDAPIKAVVDRIKGELVTRQSRINGEATQIIKAIEDAKQEPATTAEQVKRLEAAAKLMAAKNKSFNDAIKSSGLGQGSNNPKLRTRMEAGKISHTVLQADCKESEITIGDQRIDCLRECKVIEIKPDTTSGRTKGPGQAKGYHQALMKLFADDPAELAKKLPRVVKECVKGGKLTLTAEVEYYKFCPADVKGLELGTPFHIEVADIAAVDLTP